MGKRTTLDIGIEKLEAELGDIKEGYAEKAKRAEGIAIAIGILREVKTTRSKNSNGGGADDNTEECAS